MAASDDAPAGPPAGPPSPDDEPAAPAPARFGGHSRSSVLRGGVWSAAANILPMGSTLALSVVISRVLGAEVLGEQSLVAYVASLMVSVLIYSFTMASVQLVAAAGGAGDRARLAHLGRWSMGAHLLGGLVAVVVLVGTGLGRDSYNLIWYLAAATAFVDAVGWGLASRHIAQHGWSATSARRLVSQALTPLLGIAAVLLGAGVAGVFATQLLVSLGLLVALRRLERRDPLPSPAGLPAPAALPVVRLWSLFALAALVTQVVDRRLELVFLDLYRTSVEVAQYSVAFNVVGIALVVCSSLVAASVPAVAAAHGAGEHDRVVSGMSRAARVLAAVSVLLAAGVAAVGPAVVLAFWGAEEYTEAAGVVRLLAIGLVVTPLGALCTAYWTGTGRLRPVLVCGGTGAVVDIALAFLLIPDHGTSGAVVATLSGQGSAALLIIGHTLRTGLPLRIRPTALLRVALVAVVAGVGASAVTAVLASAWLGLVLGGGTFVVLAAVGLRLVGLLDPEDGRWLAETLPGPAARGLRLLTPARSR
ncbi:polysaccharide biosynthesis C-terminal domain-containing protein [Pseudokineococcus lusitanus]|uniref:O-antigen/teichoic acid export membrane protein n=1 Tax=Pseudokineococcus lusitanus TaxID=763993 RepID=A0A3N1HMK4_9ACTN|nr:polysaccharide biosynthesis C-terminal domain-containing protein [Pseudokineococcus lusitanus]ROP43696.1 O-antigen/teichoic acid export membrane protein [Pseudokineococcus lusitanus]